MLPFGINELPHFQGGRSVVLRGCSTVHPWAPHTVGAVPTAVPRGRRATSQLRLPVAADANQGSLCCSPAVCGTIVAVARERGGCTPARRAALAVPASDDRRAAAHLPPERSCERSHAMAFFPSAPDADMKRTLAREPAIGMPFSQLNEAVMRGDAPFSAGERELLAAYVSALNGCDYCQCEHAALATAFGLPAGLLAQLLQDVGTAEVSEAFRAAVVYARKL